MRPISWPAWSVSSGASYTNTTANPTTIWPQLLWQRAIFTNTIGTMSYTFPNTNSLTGPASLYFAAYGATGGSIMVGISGNVSGPLASQVVTYTTAPSYTITPAYYSIFFTAGTDTTLTITVGGNLSTTDVYLSDWSVFVGRA